MIKTFNANGYRLPTGSLLRISPRPPAERQIGYDASFDARTLVYDAILERSKVRLICPPLLNLVDIMREAVFVAHPSGEFSQAKIEPLRNIDEIIVPTPAGTTSLTIRHPMLPETPTISTQNDLLQFYNMRVLFTLSKDNEINWILDWVRFHRDIHNINAVLIFDNESTRYTPSELAGALSAVGGIERSVVVSWPYPYGPGGGPMKRWDSNYSQSGALAVARWRFLAEAEGVMNSDVDELLVGKDRTTVFEAASKSPHLAISYPSAWVYGIDGVTPHRELSERRFDDYSYREHPTPIGQSPKWTILPNRNRTPRQWCTHWLSEIPSTEILSHNFGIRHFREINTSWKHVRNERYFIDSPEVEIDRQLTSSFARVNWKR